MLRYVQGDATLPAGDSARVITHIVNDRGGWGKGFVLALRALYPEAEVAYRRWARRLDETAPPFSLGEVQFVEVGPALWVANILAQHGVQSRTDPVPLDYPALARGLAMLAWFARDNQASIHMPHIGAGLAGGDWEQIVALLNEYLGSCDVTVYDLPQR